MKNILIIVVLVIVIIIGVSLKNKKSATLPVVTNTDTATTSSKVEGVNLSDGTYAINPADAKITWTGKKVVLKNWIDTGSVKLQTGNFVVKDKAVVSNAFVIDMKSIAAIKTGMGEGKGNDMLSTHLKSADFFDVEKYPTSTFVVKSFATSTTNATSTASTTESYLVTGDMTIKGITKEITIPTTFTTVSTSTVMVAGSVNLDRTLWDVRYGSGKFFKDLGDKVIDDMFNIAFEFKMSL